MPGPGPEKNKGDVDNDPRVAAAREDSGEDGSYVGQASGDDFDAGERGAEARSTD